MRTSLDAWAVATALFGTGLLFAPSGCDRQPPARPPTAVASVGANYYPSPPNVGVLSPAPAPSRRDSAAVVKTSTTPPSTPATPDMGAAGTVTTPQTGVNESSTVPSDTGGVVLDKIGQNLIRGVGPQLTAFATPTAAHHKLAFAIGKGIAGDGSGPGGQPIKYLGHAVQATFPYVLARLKPDLKIDDASLAAAEAEFKTKMDAVKKSDDTGAASFGTVQAFAFGTASLNDSNECYQGLIAIKLGDQPAFPDLSVDSVRSAIAGVVKIVLPNAKSAGLEMTLPSDLTPDT